MSEKGICSMILDAETDGLFPQHMQEVLQQLESKLTAMYGLPQELLSEVKGSSYSGMRQTAETWKVRPSLPCTSRSTK